MRARKLGQLTLVLFCLAVLPIAAAQTQPIPSSPSAQHADALYQAQKWPEAAKAYEAITKAEPDNGRAWLRLGVSLHQSGQYEAAITAYQQALDKVQGQTKPLAMYNLAGANARLNNKDEALQWLTRLSSGGMPPFAAGQLKTDEDFASLRDDPRFKDLLTVADKVLRPCMDAPQVEGAGFLGWRMGGHCQRRTECRSTSRDEQRDPGRRRVCHPREVGRVRWADGTKPELLQSRHKQVAPDVCGQQLWIWEMSGEYQRRRHAV